MSVQVETFISTGLQPGAMAVQIMIGRVLKVVSVLKAAEGRRSPRRFALAQVAANAPASWSAPVLWRFSTWNQGLPMLIETALTRTPKSATSSCDAPSQKVQATPSSPVGRRFPGLAGKMRRGRCNHPAATGHRRYPRRDLSRISGRWIFRVARRRCA